MSGIAIPIPKTFLSLDSDLYDGVWNIWFKADDAATLTKLPDVVKEIPLPLSDKKITITRTMKDMTDGRYAIQVRVEPKVESTTTAGAAPGATKGISARTVFLAFGAIMLAVGAFYLTFDKIERVLDEGETTFALWGLAALAIAIWLIVRAVKK